MIYVLIIWTLGCTSLETIETCPAGDFAVQGTFRSRTICEEKAKSWLIISKDNRAVCLPVEDTRHSIAGKVITNG